MGNNARSGRKRWKTASLPASSCFDHAYVPRRILMFWSIQIISYSDDTTRRKFMSNRVNITINITMSFLQLSGEQDHILTRGSNELHPFTMLLPSLLRTIASIVLFTGLYLTYATSFQMIRGTIISSHCYYFIFLTTKPLRTYCRRCIDLCGTVQHHVLEPNIDLSPLVGHFHHDMRHHRYIGFGCSTRGIRFPISVAYRSQYHPYR